jgi:hypothetical protein
MNALSIDDILFRLVNSGFLELAGLQADASIPLPESLVNEITGIALRGSRAIADCRLSIHNENRVAVSLRTQLWPWPLHLRLRLERSVDLTDAPKIRAKLENHVLLGKIGAVLKALPEGISLKNNQVVIDVQTVLTAPEQRRLLKLVKSMEIHTEEAKVILDVKVEVEENAR